MIKKPFKYELQDWQKSTKEKLENLFLLIKTSLSLINHKKIVQIIINNYCPQLYLLHLQSPKQVNANTFKNFLLKNSQFLKEIKLNYLYKDMPQKLILLKKVLSQLKFSSYDKTLYLNLNHLHLAYDQPEQIFQSFSLAIQEIKYSKITTFNLNLYNNGLANHSIQMKQVSQGIYSLKFSRIQNLNLNLGCNSIGTYPEDLENLGKALSGISQLQSLQIFELEMTSGSLGAFDNNVKFFSLGLSDICKNAHNLRKMKLELSYNQLSKHQQNFQYFSEFLENLRHSNMEELYLDICNNQIGTNPTDVQYICKGLQSIQYSKITDFSLFLYANDIGKNQNDIQSLCDGIQSLKNSKIQKFLLYLYSNEFQNSYLELPKLAKSISELKYSNITNFNFNFYCNHLTTFKIFKEFMVFIKELTQSKIKQFQFTIYNNFLQAETYQQMEKNFKEIILDFLQPFKQQNHIQLTLKLDTKLSLSQLQEKYLLNNNQNITII